MADQYRLGKNGTKSARLCQFDQGDDQMNQEDGEVAHCGNRTKARQPVGFGPIREFAMDRLSISRSIALEHGGTLELDKESPHTCFRLKLPLSGMPKSNAQLKKR